MSEIRGEIPLILAEKITQETNNAFENEEIYNQVSPITQRLLHFWFDDEQKNSRLKNFHKGQEQAIKNMIYLFEVKKVQNLADIYAAFYKEAMGEILDEVYDSKNDFVKFCIKMATGTGKTWVMNAFVIWQYLNAKLSHDTESSVKFYKNFVLLAPGLIVYERLLDSYQGRMMTDENGNECGRDVLSSDIAQNRELFVPEEYREEILNFLGGSVFDKENKRLEARIGGFLLVANWHFLDKEKEEITPKDLQENPLSHIKQIAQGVLPLYPNVRNTLESLDRAVRAGEEVGFLASLDHLCVINDEAHHIYNEDDKESKWEALLKQLSSQIKKSGGHFMQCDFSATPYIPKKTKKQTNKNHFLHIVVDFELKMAINAALVKNISLSKRSTLASIENLDFRSIKDSDGNIIELSQGQKIMIDAGLKQLEGLEEQFLKLDGLKYPKMLIVCEQQEVIKYVENYLELRGFDKSNDVLSIYSDKKNEVKAEEYKRIKTKLFGIDHHKEPKIIISVLMLREGFDVGNICVIVPLRASESEILIEQTIGRGLRLMWRSDEGEQMRRENLKALQNHLQPKSYIDHLFIIEHPSFERFYDEMIKGGLVFVDDDGSSPTSATGTLIPIGLREDYKDYELYWYKIISEGINSNLQENLKKRLSQELPAFEYPLDTLLKIAGSGERFYSENLSTQTRFGGFEINQEVFNAGAYNEYLRLLCESVSGKLEGQNLSIRIQGAEYLLAERIDKYIRYELFRQEFNPFTESKWRVLCLENVSKHIFSIFLRLCCEPQKDEDIQVSIEKIAFSSQSKSGFLYKKEHTIEGTKTIYTHIPLPVNKGGLEKLFVEWIQKESTILKIIKIMENKKEHNFAFIPYLKSNGMMGKYFADFIVETQSGVYLVELKADKDIRQDDVRRKKKAAQSYINQINQALDLNTQSDTKKWHYLLVSENQFYQAHSSRGGFEWLTRFILQT